jgi:hypothetical protein
LNTETKQPQQAERKDALEVSGYVQDAAARAAAQPLSLWAYFDQLSRFDWDFESTDDGEVYRAAVKRRDELLAMAQQSPNHQNLYDKFRNYEHLRVRKALGDDVVVPPPPLRPVKSEAA